MWRHREAVILTALAAGCGGAPSTLPLNVTVDPPGLAFSTLRVEVLQGTRSIAVKDFDWDAAHPRLGVYLPSDLSGPVEALGRALDGRGAVVAAGEASGDVTAGQVSAPVALLLRAAPTTGPDGGAPGGSPDAALPADAAADRAPDGSPPADAAVPDHAPPPTAPTETPHPLRPFNGEGTGSAFNLFALHPVFSWVPVPGAAGYEIEIDGTCPPETLASCPFSSPAMRARPIEPRFVPSGALEVSMTPPVGHRYTWRVRACNGDACGPWSAVRYVDVGRQRQDYNGDGYADVLAGTGVGGAAVFLGGRALDNQVDLEVPASGATGDVVVAPAGDINADGFGDFLIAQPDAGKVLLVFGGATLHATADVTLTGSVDDAFGTTAAGAGDVDGDGFADVLVGAPGAKPMPAAHLFRGGRQGTRPAVTLTNAAKNFGRAVSSAGDMNGDGYADILVGTDRQTLVYFGGAVFDSTPDFTYAFFPRIGEGLTPLGDLDGDGYADVLIVAPEVVVRRGGPTLVDDGPTLPDGAWSASAGDLDGDGKPDILLQSIHESALLFPSGKPLTAATFELTGPPDEAYGVGAVVGDVNGDGFSDFVIAAPDRTVAGQAVGVVELYLGASNQLDIKVDQSYPGTGLGQGLAGTVARAPQGRPR